MLLKLIITFLVTLYPYSVFANSMSATYYTNKLAGKRMASGHVYSPYSNTIATNKYKLGTRLKVCYRNRCVVGVVRDRCNCSIDLSKSLFRQLTSPKKGRINVRVYRY